MCVLCGICLVASFFSAYVASLTTPVAVQTGFYIFYCFILFYIVLYCFILFYIVLYCFILFYIVLYCFILFYFVYFVASFFFFLPLLLH